MRLFRFSLTRILGIAGLLSCFASAGFAGTKNTGSGLFHSGYTEEAAGIGINPALIFDVPNRWDSSFGFIQQDGYVKSRDFADFLPGFNGKFNTTKLKFWPAADFGYCQLITENLGIGISTRPLGQFIKVTCQRPLPFEGTSKYGIEQDIAPIIPCIAYRWGAHTFGIGIPLVVARFYQKGQQNLQINTLFPNKVTNNGYNYSRGIGLQLGYRLQVTPCLAFGASYIFTTHLAPYKKYKGLAPQRGGADIAPNITAGLAWTVLNGRLILSLDGQIILFNGVRTTHNSPFTTAPGGSKHGPGAGLRNQPSLGCGAAYRLTEATTIRAGYLYSKAGIPGKYTISNVGGTLLIPRHFISGGATYQMGCWDVSVAALYGFRHTVRGKPLPAFVGPLEGGRIDLTHEFCSFSMAIGHAF